MTDRPASFAAARVRLAPRHRQAMVLALDGPELAALADRLTDRVAAPAGAGQGTAALVAALLARGPRAIATPLFALSPDILDLVEHLSRAGYRGRVLALAPPLPNRRLVQRELAAMAPGLRLRLVTLAALAPRG